MTFPTTTLYALPLILIFLILFFRVSARRSDLKVSIGDAGDAILHERIRQHGNFIAQAINCRTHTNACGTSGLA